MGVWTASGLAVLGLSSCVDELALGILNECRLASQKRSKVHAMTSATHKWSFRRLFSSARVQPLPHLLNESLVDRHVARQTPAITVISQSGAMRGFSPIASLPEDLLQRVFITYLDTLEPTPTDRCVIKYTHDRLQAPFLLSSVCRSWRTHTLASPSLWTYVVVPALVHGPDLQPQLVTRHIKQRLKQLNKRWLELIRLLLARSGHVGLDIIIPKLHVGLLGPNVAKEFELHRNAVLALAPHRARIRSLCMSPDGPITSSAVWDIVGTPHVIADGTTNIHASHLERLELRIPQWGVEQSLVHLEAPRLRVCMIEGATCLRPQQAPLVWLEASVRANTLVAWSQMVSICAVTLENLHLRISSTHDNSEHALRGSRLPSSRIIFSRLSHFGITTTAYPPETLLAEVLSIVSTPALCSAHFVGTYRDPPATTAFVQFAKYLGNPANGLVKDLAISYLPEHGVLDIGDAQTIARHLQSLKILTMLPHSNVAVGFIGAMHHLVPHVRICFESTNVWLPIGSPQEQLIIAVDTSGLDNGTTGKQRLAFFDVTQVDRDYETITRTENIYPSQQCVIQVINDAAVVWRDGPVEQGGESGEQPLGPGYKIIPSQLSQSPDPYFICGCCL